MKKDGCSGCDACETCEKKVEVGKDGKIPNPNIPRFLSMAGVVAAKYGLTVEIDMENEMIDFQGDVNESQEIACAMEIASLFGKYSRD